MNYQHPNPPQVFDGRPNTGQPYIEASATHPLNAYGQAKAEMEQALVGYGTGGAHVADC